MQTCYIGCTSLVTHEAIDRVRNLLGGMLKSAIMHTAMKGKYEDNFESIDNRSIVISDLIEQILRVEEVIVRHQQAGTSGLELDQYIERRSEFQDSLNERLSTYRFALVRKEAA